MKKEGLLIASALLTMCAFSSGFGLYEASSASYALGGAVLGRACDASAGFFNPATLTDLTNITLTAGFMTEHPRARIKTDMPGGRTCSMDPGAFCLPHFHAAVPLPWDFVFGFGCMPEYGLGSEYNESWDLNFNSKDTTVTSVTMNPNLAWKATDKLSLGAGMRVIYFDFEQHSNPVIDYYGYKLGNNHYKLKGDNGMSDYGYQVGAKYDLLDNFSIGATYKSETRVHVKGYTRMRGPTALLNGGMTGDAHTTLVLPQSLTLGCNWDITDKWHLGTAIAWTEWSSVGILNFHVPAPGRPNNVKKIKLDWDDTWRFAIAPSWDFAEEWTWLASYVYETDCCGNQDSTMLPPSERHMISTGFVWHYTENLDFALTYGVILMAGHNSDCTDTTNTGKTYHYDAHRALSHASGFTVTYRF